MIPALFNRLVKLGFEPGTRNPEEWAVSRLEELTAEKKKMQEAINKIEHVVLWNYGSKVAHLIHDILEEREDEQA